jgi:NAD(P)-dependent dehydrogenase (short-subunit alcohol dehydrogenase family)
MTLFDMKGKVAVITGSTRGIGRAIAERMAEHGAKVVISSRKQDACDLVLKEINDMFGKGTAVAIAANISSKENLQNLVDESNKAFGKIDVLVCNAASNPYYGPLAGISDDQFNKILGNNIVANNWIISMVVPQMIEPCDRTVVNGECKAALGLVAKRDTDRGLDRPAVRHRDDVPARVFGVDALDAGFDAVVKIHETFAVRRRFVDRRKPVAADGDGAACKKRRAVEPLPIAEVLFVEVCLLRHGVGLRKTRSPDRCRSLMRPLQLARDPHRIARQDLADRVEHNAVAAIAIHVFLTIDIAAVVAHRRVPHPPPPRRDHACRNGVLRNEPLLGIGHRQSPSIVFHAAVSEL